MKSEFDCVDLLGINHGFVSDQIEEKYNNFGFDSAYFSKETVEEDKKRLEIQKAYKFLLGIKNLYVIGGMYICPPGKMIDEIASLIHNDYVLKEKKLDLAFIANLSEIIVSARSLQDYVRYVNFINHSKDKATAIMNTYRRELDVFINNIKALIDVNIQYDELSSLYAPFIISSSTIFHEYEHADQSKIINLNGSDVKTKILSAMDNRSNSRINNASNLFSLILVSINTGIDIYRYNKHYNFAPEERMAYIYAFSKCLELIKALSIKNSKNLDSLLNRYSLCFVNSILSNYEIVDSPTGYYFQKQKLLKEISEIQELSKNLSLEERLYLGLNVNEYEKKLVKNDFGILGRVSSFI